MVVAIVALVLALTGTGIAASRHIITSTSQINPSVLRQLRGGPIAHAATLTVKRYANRITTPVNSGVTTIIEVPGIAKLTSTTCEEGQVRASATNLGSGTDISLQRIGDGSAPEASYNSSWSSVSTYLNHSPNVSVQTLFEITSGTGTSSLIAEIRLNMTTANSTGSVCVFAATAQVYKG